MVDRLVAVREREWNRLLESCGREGEFGHWRLGAPPVDGNSRAQARHSEGGVSCFAGWALPDGAVVLDYRQLNESGRVFCELIALDPHRRLHRLSGKPIKRRGSGGEVLLRAVGAERVPDRPISFVGSHLLTPVIADVAGRPS